jgi:hypothetical protein
MEIIFDLHKEYHDALQKLSNPICMEKEIQ